MIGLHTSFRFWKESQGRCDSINNIEGVEVWYGPDEEKLNYVRLIDAPHTLAHEIIHRRKDIPVYGCNIEVVGDAVHYNIDSKPFVEFDECGVPDDVEDCQATMSLLPVVCFDPEKHFVKLPTYNQEIVNLMLCRGSPYIVQLLGRTEEATPKLVFERHPHDLLVAAGLNRGEDRVFNIKKWMLQLVEGVSFMHSLGLVHRDLLARNILIGNPITSDAYAGDAVIPGPVVICDLECRHASLKAPEVRKDGDFAPASDVYCLGYVLWQLCYYNNPVDRFLLQDFSPPPPFDEIFMECMKEDPHKRPTLEKLKTMLMDISVDGYN